MNPLFRNGTLVRTGCAILFFIFSFCYLYVFQADMLTVTQHVLSHGKTMYNPLVGAILITLVLYMLQLLVSRITRLRRYVYALTYLPSMLCLAVLTGESYLLEHRDASGVWWIVVPVAVLCVYAFVVYVIRQNQLSDGALHDIRHIQVVWVNLLTMGVMCLLTVCCSQTSRTFHYRMRMEQALMQADYGAVCQIADKSGVADSAITLMRAYALAQQGLLGERLFAYPVTGGSRALLPDSCTVRLLLYPERRIYYYLGAHLRQKMRPTAYLEYICRHRLATQMGRDYLLTAYLLDRRLDRFAHAVGRFYHIDDSLPRHYREALVLYNHRHSEPCVQYSNSVMEADFNDYQKLYHSTADHVVRQSLLHDSYGNTYWYYYQYGEGYSPPILY